MLPCILSTVQACTKADFLHILLPHTKPGMRQAVSQLRREICLHRVVCNTCVHVGKAADESRVLLPCYAGA